MKSTIRLMSRKALPMSSFNALVGTTVCALAVALALASPVGSIQNPPRSTVASGGTVAAQSATHRVSGAIGQVSSVKAQSATHSAVSGFWNTVWTCNCAHIGDITLDNQIDVFDVVEMVNIAFRNATIPPSESLCPLVTIADLNCDTEVDILDVVVIVGVAFRNLDGRCNPCEQ